MISNVTYKVKFVGGRTQYSVLFCRGRLTFIKKSFMKAEFAKNVSTLNAIAEVFWFANDINFC